MILSFDKISFFRLHSTVTPDPPKLSNRAPKFTSGYRLNGEYFFDEPVVLNKTIPSNIFHSFRIIIDKESIPSTKVFIDENYVGNFREHFVSRLQGGVFVDNKIGSVGLFENFVLKGCTIVTEKGICENGK